MSPSPTSQVPKPAPMWAEGTPPEPLSRGTDGSLNTTLFIFGQGWGSRFWGWALPSKTINLHIPLSSPSRNLLGQGPVMSPFVIPHPHTCSSEGTETIRQILQKEKLRLGEADRTRELEGGETKCRNRKIQKQHKRAGRAKKRVHSQVTRPFHLSLQLC